MRSDKGWTVIAGSLVGTAFSSIIVFASGYAILSHALGEQFGWNQRQVAAGATIFMLAQMAMQPVIGWALTRYGSRRVIVASLLGFSSALLLLGQIADTLPGFYFGVAIVSAVSAGTNVISYARAISQWFDRSRGLALGIAASGSSVGLLLIPFLAQRGLAAFGWSTALVVSAAFIAVVCLPVVAASVRDRVDARHHFAASAACAVDAEHNFLGATFVKLFIAFAVAGLSTYAIVPNLVYIFRSKAGLDVGNIVLIQSLMGGSVLLGRVGYGFLLDRVATRWLGVTVAIATAIYLIMFATVNSFGWTLAAAIIGGCVVGGDGDLIPFSASRYFPPEVSSKVLGWFMFAFLSGAATGPLLFAEISEATGGITDPLLMLAALQLLPLALFLSLTPDRMVSEPKPMPAP